MKQSVKIIGVDELEKRKSDSLDMQFAIATAIAFQKGFEGYEAKLLEISDVNRQSFEIPFVKIKSRQKIGQSLPFSWHSCFNLNNGQDLYEALTVSVKSSGLSVFHFSSMKALSAQHHAAFLKAGFKYDNPESDILTLKGRDFDKIFKENFSVKVRNQCRKALKSGMKIYLSKDQEHIRQYYKLYLEATKNWGKAEPPYPLNFFMEIIPLPQVDFWVAELDDVFLGGIIVLKYEGWLYYWSGMINREHAALCINNGLLHEALQFYTGQQQNEYFNFGPSESLWSVKKFKESWGTESFHHHHYKWQSFSSKAVIQPLMNFKKWIGR